MDVFGLIFFGLETMGGSALPLVETPWFRELLRRTVASPAVAFPVGVAVAAVLQSNTASTLLIVTLAGSAFHPESALMMIYGTNLGAIVLRLLLAAELRGTSLQLVRFEDLFCLASGVIMVALFYAETLAYLEGAEENYTKEDRCSVGKGLLFGAVVCHRRSWNSPSRFGMAVVDVRY